MKQIFYLETEKSHVSLTWLRFLFLGLLFPDEEGGMHWASKAEKSLLNSAMLKLMMCWRRQAQAKGFFLIRGLK